MLRKKTVGHCLKIDIEEAEEAEDWRFCTSFSQRTVFFFRLIDDNGTTNSEEKFDKDPAGPENKTYMNTANLKGNVENDTAVGSLKMRILISITGRCLKDWWTILEL